MHGKRVEHLAAIREVGCKRIDARAIQRHEIDVEDFMPLPEQIGYDMPAGLAAATGKNDPLCHALPSLSGIVRLTPSTTRATSPDFDVSPQNGRTFPPAAASACP